MNEEAKGWLKVAAESEECVLELNKCVAKRKDRIIAFLAQQTIEAYLKAALAMFNPTLSPEKTHDISLLLQQLSEYVGVPEEFGEKGAVLTSYATTKLYEVAEPIAEKDTRMAVYIMKLVSLWAHKEIFKEG